MADKLSLGDLNEMQESVKETTDLSKKLRDVFEDIKIQTDLTGNSFSKIIEDAKNNNNLSERYLIGQKASEVITAKINELKSKSSYLDELSLKFKEQEVKLQRDIIDEQIKAIRSSLNLSSKASQEAIDKLETKKVLQEAELKVLQNQNGAQNDVVSQLNTQLSTIREFTPELEKNTGYLSKFSKYIGGSNTEKLAKDLGKMGNYLKDGLPSAKKFFHDLIEVGYENFKAFDKTAASVRSHLGVLPGQAKQLEGLIKQIGIDSMHLGVTFGDVGNSINAITDEFTSFVAQDKNLLTTTSALAKQFGIAEATSVKFLKTLGGISGNSASSQKSMIGFAQKMAQASGVPLGKIMEDVANASDDVRIYVGSSAVSMIKAAAAARMMGIDLNKAATSAEKLLNFESSISAELKASAILGQNVNFNYARQLSFNKDIIGANKEILKIAKQVNFNQLNPIQQKAFAEAAGKTVGELQDMLTQEKNMQLVANSTNKDVRRRYEEYQRLMKLKEEDAKNEGKLAEQEFLRKANQEKLTQIQNKFNQLMSELAEPVMEVLDGFLTIATIALPYIKLSILPIITVTQLLSKYIASFGTKFMVWGRAVSIYGSRVGMITRSIGLLARNFGPLVKMFGTKIPVIGWIISGLLVIRNLIRDAKKLFDGGENWGSKIVKGLLLIPKAIIEAFLPFDIVKEKLDKWFFGKSPSKAGKLIMKGFSSIGPDLQNSLVEPINAAYKDIENIESPDIKVDNVTTNRLTTQPDNSLISTIRVSNQQLIAKIDQLMNMMANGGIAVNLDGQLVTRQLATTSYRSGGFGQATSLS